MQVVKLVLTLPHGSHEACRLEYFKVLRDRLPRQSDLVFHCQARAEFEKRLTVSLNQFVENCPPGRRRDRLEDIAHTP